MFKISQIKIADTYICFVCWPTTEWQIDKVANTSAGHMGISRAGGSDLWGLTCEFLESWTFWCFLCQIFIGGEPYSFNHFIIPNKWFEKIWTNCARWIKWSGAKLCVDKIQTAINYFTVKDHSVLHAEWLLLFHNFSQLNSHFSPTYLVLKVREENNVPAYLVLFSDSDSIKKNTNFKQKSFSIELKTN